MKYLYSFGDAGMEQSDRAPAEGELSAINDGELTVLRFQDGRFQWINLTGNWEDVTPMTTDPTPDPDPPQGDVHSVIATFTVNNELSDADLRDTIRAAIDHANAQLRACGHPGVTLVDIIIGPA